MKVCTKSSNVESLESLKSAEGNGELLCVLHFSLLLTKGDSLSLLHAADLCIQLTFQQEKRLL